jgi:hypothetical protein
MSHNLIRKAQQFRIILFVPRQYPIVFFLLKIEYIKHSSESMLKCTQKVVLPRK